MNKTLTDKELTLTKWKVALISGVLCIILTGIVLYTINFFTLFGYYLPHQNTFVDIAPGDGTMTSKPAYLTIDLDKIQLGDWTITNPPLEYGGLIITLSPNKATITGLQDIVWLGEISGISMFPTMDDDSRIIFESIANIDDIKTGDIIVFNHPHVNTPTAHRVDEVGNDVDGWYAYTLADNSTVQTGIEPYMVRQHQVIGKARIYIDY